MVYEKIVNLQNRSMMLERSNQKLGFLHEVR